MNTTDIRAGQQAWQVPTLLNGWVNFGLPQNPTGYMKDSLGFVHLRGLPKGGIVGQGTPIFTLPVGYRPAYQHIFGAKSDSMLGDIRVNPEGTVALSSGSNGWVTLDGVIFKAEQ